MLLQTAKKFQILPDNRFALRAVAAVISNTSGASAVSTDLVFAPGGCVTLSVEYYHAAASLALGLALAWGDPAAGPTQPFVSCGAPHCC